MLPAVIIHLLDIKSSSAVTRELSLQGFGLCMQVMQILRENYAAADFATHFLEAAVKKANIQIPVPTRQRFQTADDAMKALNRQRAMIVKRGFQTMQDNLYVPRSEGILGHVDMGVAVSVGTNTPREDHEMGGTETLDHQNLHERISAFLNEESQIAREDYSIVSGQVPENKIADGHPMNIDLNELLLKDPETDFTLEQQSPSSSTGSHTHFSGSELSENVLDNIDSLFVHDNDPFIGAYDGQGIGEGTAFSLELSLMSGAVADGGMELLSGDKSINDPSDATNKMLENVEFDFDRVMDGL